jgi:integrase/recombinase XerD
LIPTQIQAILAQPDPFTRQGRRDLALLLLLVDTGASISETLALRQDNVDLITLQITFRGNTTKTRRTRLLPISKRTASALRTVLIETETENNNVFQARSGKQRSYKRWVALLHLYAKQAGVQA